MKLDLAILAGAESKAWLLGVENALKKFEKLVTRLEKANGKTDSDGDDSDDEDGEDDSEGDDAEDKKPAKRGRPKKQKEEAEDEEDDADEEDEGEEDEDGDDSEGEEEDEDGDDSEDEEEDEDETPPAKKKAAKGKAVKGKKTKKVTPEDVNDVCLAYMAKVAKTVKDGKKLGIAGAQKRVQVLLKKQFGVERAGKLSPEDCAKAVKFFQAKIDA